MSRNFHRYREDPYNAQQALDMIQDYACAQRGVPVKGISITQPVLCSFATNSRRMHEVTVVTRRDGVVCSITCTCDQLHGKGGSLAGARLGLKNTCGLAARLILDMVRSTSQNDEHEELENRYSATYHESVDFVVNTAIEVNATKQIARRLQTRVPWVRPAVRILSDRFAAAIDNRGERVTCDPHGYRVELFRGRPTKIFHKDDLLAKRVDTLHDWRVTELRNVAHTLGRIGYSCTICDKRIDPSSIRRHFRSRAHQTKAEKRLVKALATLTARGV